MTDKLGPIGPKTSCFGPNLFGQNEGLQNKAH